MSNLKFLVMVDIFCGVTLDVIGRMIDTEADNIAHKMQYYNGNYLISAKNTDECINKILDECLRSYFPEDKGVITMYDVMRRANELRSRELLEIANELHIIKKDIRLEDLPLNNVQF